nr:hypothetical protein [uncultured Trichococcus sp.]
MKGKYLEFRELGTSASGKTKIISVVNDATGSALGQIRWFAPWRKYTFHTCFGNVFDSSCLSEIVNELDRLNKEHKGEAE